MLGKIEGRHSTIRDGGSDHGLTGDKMKSDLLRFTQIYSEFSLPGRCGCRRALGENGILVEIGRDRTAANPSYLDLSRLAFVVRTAENGC